MVRELTAIAGEHGKNGSSKYDRKNPKIAILSKMIDYVQHNYVRQITLEEIASAGSVGRTKCAQIFHEMVDQTPIEFVNDVRMRAGAEMLDTTSMPVSDIAKKLGFSSSTFFTRTFKQYMHTTPTAYRRNMLK